MQPTGNTLSDLARAAALGAASAFLLALSAAALLAALDEQSAEIAQRCVEPFARFLLDEVKALGPAPHIVLVAHSLGCLIATRVAERVASEAHGGVRLTLVLMAAAIPVDGDYRCLRDRARTTVLYSAKDETLYKWYPLGQRNALGLPAEAVGLHGRPEKGQWDVREDMHCFDHRDYWKLPLAAQRVSEILLANAEVVPRVRAPIAVAHLAERDMPAPRRLADRWRWWRRRTLP